MTWTILWYQIWNVLNVVLIGQTVSPQWYLISCSNLYSMHNNFYFILFLNKFKQNIRQYSLNQQNFITNILTVLSILTFNISNNNSPVLVIASTCEKVNLLWGCKVPGFNNVAIHPCTKTILQCNNQVFTIILKIVRGTNLHNCCNFFPIFCKILFSAFQKIGYVSLFHLYKPNNLYQNSNQYSHVKPVFQEGHKQQVSKSRFLYLSRASAYRHDQDELFERKSRVSLLVSHFLQICKLAHI